MPPCGGRAHLVAEGVGLAVREAGEAGGTAAAEEGAAPALARDHHRQHAGQTHQADAEQLRARDGQG